MFVKLSNVKYLSLGTCSRFTIKIWNIEFLEEFGIKNQLFDFIRILYKFDEKGGYHFI